MDLANSFQKGATLVLSIYAVNVFYYKKRNLSYRKNEVQIGNNLRTSLHKQTQIWKR